MKSTEYWETGYIAEVKRDIVDNIMAYQILYDTCIDEIARIMKKDIALEELKLTNYEIY